MKAKSSRREFIRQAVTASATVLAMPSFLQGAGSATRRKMKLSLSAGAIGVKASPREVFALAQKHGFEAVEANAAFLTDLSDTELSELRADMRAKGLVFGAAGLSVDFRHDDGKFREGMRTLPHLAEGLKQAGAEQVGTWVSPAHDELDYERNLHQHATRLREIARVLKDNGLRLGLEYVGTPTGRQGHKYPFIHSMREMGKLIAEIGTGNVGYVLDTWHWWTAGETEADLLSLKASDVVSVDMNDAPAGIPIESQQDGQRELPCATGVIPTKVFVNALNRINYDGPVRCEPFNKALARLDKDAACAAVITALRKAMDLIE